MHKDVAFLSSLVATRFCTQCIEMVMKSLRLIENAIKHSYAPEKLKKEFPQELLWLRMNSIAGDPSEEINNLKELLAQATSVSEQDEELPQTNTTPQNVEAELAKVKTELAIEKSHSEKAETELKSYLKRLEESQMENMTQFRSSELATARAARAGSSNIINKGIDYYFWAACVFCTVYYIGASWVVFSYRADFVGMSGECELCNAIYFVAVLSSSVGYGDIYPNSDATVTLTLLLIFASGINAIFARIIFGRMWTLFRRIFVDNVEENRRTYAIWIYAAVLISSIFVVGTDRAMDDLEKSHRIENASSESKIASTERPNVVRDAMALSYITLTTVGFGNISFKTSGGRIFACIWISLSVPAFTSAYMYLMEQILFCIPRSFCRSA